MKVGKATVYIDAEELGLIESDGEIRPVAPSAQEAFRSALDVIEEGIGALGDRIRTVAETMRPAKVEAEFAVTFKANLEGRLIPVFVTGSLGSDVGLKVKAIWETKPSTP